MFAHTMFVLLLLSCTDSYSYSRLEVWKETSNGINVAFHRKVFMIQKGDKTFNGKTSGNERVRQVHRTSSVHIYGDQLRAVCDHIVPISL